MDSRESINSAIMSVIGLVEDYINDIASIEELTGVVVDEIGEEGVSKEVVAKAVIESTGNTRREDVIDSLLFAGYQGNLVDEIVEYI